MYLYLCGFREEFISSHLCCPFEKFVHQFAAVVLSYLCPGYRETSSSCSISFVYHRSSLHFSFSFVLTRITAPHLVTSNAQFHCLPLSPPSRLPHSTLASSKIIRSVVHLSIMLLLLFPSIVLLPLQLPSSTHLHTFPRWPYRWILGGQRAKRLCYQVGMGRDHVLPAHRLHDICGMSAK